MGPRRRPITGARREGNRRADTRKLAAGQERASRPRGAEASIVVMWTSSAKPITVKVRVLKGKKKPTRLFGAKKKVRSPSLDRKNTQRFTWKTRGKEP